MEPTDFTRIPDNIPRVKEIEVDNSVYTIHCYRYAAKSDFFRILLTQEFAEKSMKKIKLYGIDADIFEKISILFNTGKVDLTFEDVVPLYATCRYLLVKEKYLKPLQTFILNNLKELDIFNLLEYCKANNDSLLHNVKGYLAPQLELLFNLESFRIISVEALTDIILDTRVKASHEDTICWIVATWLAHCQDRKKYVNQILQKISPTKFNKDFQSIFMDIQWNPQEIADTLWYLIFEWQPRIQRPLRSEFFQPDEPLYASNEEGILLLTHFEGSQWSILNAPRSPLHPSAKILAAARHHANVNVAISEPDSAYNLQTSVLHYNFRSKKIIEIAKPAQGEIKGLYYINDKLFSNTKDILQQYCPEHNLWLNPIDIGLSHYQFSTSDAQCLFVCGYYDWSGHNSVHFYDPRSPEWIYFADVPHENQGTCGTFIGDELFMVALDYDPRSWKIHKLDIRNCKWETIMSHWCRSSATPVSIRQCKRNLIVMDHFQNSYTVPMTGGKLELFLHYQYALKPVYSID